MESIGEKLRSTRETRKLTIRDVVKQTNISPSYIEALEDEEFDRFPSETYLIGFLRSYAEFLKLDPGEMVDFYRGYKIGESITPLEELTKPTTPGIGYYIQNFYENYRTFIFIGAGVLFAGLLIFIILSFTGGDVEIKKTTSLDDIKQEYRDKEKNKGKDYAISQLQLVNNRGYVLISRNEYVQFMVAGKEVVFLIKEISPDQKEKVVFSILPHKIKVALEMNQSVHQIIPGIDNEVIFTLKGISDNRAKLFVQVGKSLKSESDHHVENVEPVKDTTTVTTLSGSSPKKIIFQARFVQKSFVEVYLDGSMKTRGFIPAGSVEKWEASQTIQVKLGNAGGIAIKINGKSYSFGGKGQVANKVIRWKRNAKDPNVYTIEVADW